MLSNRRKTRFSANMEKDCLIPADGHKNADTVPEKRRERG
jgi:hypothetical protein